MYGVCGYFMGRHAGPGTLTSTWKPPFFDGSDLSQGFQSLLWDVVDWRNTSEQGCSKHETSESDTPSIPMSRAWGVRYGDCRMWRQRAAVIPRCVPALMMPKTGSLENLSGTGRCQRSLSRAYAS